MTAKQEAANWKRLFKGVKPIKSAPAPALVKILMPKSEYAPEPPEFHSERNKDPRYQWKKLARGGRFAVHKTMGLINQAKLDAHYAMVLAQSQRP